MMIEPLEYAPHSAFNSTPPSPPLKTFLKQHHFTAKLFTCEKFNCQLTEAACVARWRRAHSKWTPQGSQWIGKGAWSGHPCTECKHGKNLSRTFQDHRPTKPKSTKTKTLELVIPDFELETEKFCSIHRCNAMAVKGENYCPRHFVINETEKKAKGLCSAEGCDRAAFSKGMCRKHYQIDYYLKKNSVV